MCLVGEKSNRGQRESGKSVVGEYGKKMQGFMQLACIPSDQAADYRPGLDDGVLSPLSHTGVQQEEVRF